MYENLIPETLEDTILSYLKGQEDVGEGFTDFVRDVKNVTAEEEVKDVLEELLVTVNKRIACRDRYDNIKNWHHQYPLFDLSHYIPSFCIDEEMLKKLAFRESLLISEVDYPSDSMEVEPRPVGGLCLDIQMVDGYLPKNREMPTDAELDRAVFQTLQKAKQAIERTPLGEESNVEKEVQKKLKLYEDFLKNKMRNNVQKFLVHFSSQFDLEGCNAGSTITAWVDRNLHTLEEKREEFLLQPDNINEKSIYVAIQNNKYYMRHTSTLQDLDLRKYYPFFITKNLVLEGANFLLMRYLAITRHVGTIELATMYINGEMCRNIYECMGPTQGHVNGKFVEVCKIYRYVIEECGIEHNCVTVLTTYGRIITQEWEGCNYIMNMNPLQHIDNKEPSSYDRLDLHKTWQDDIQLTSKYLDCKTSAEKQMKTYMVDHPEVKEMISDFVQNVLLLKPENIMAFTKDYFHNLYPCQTPRVSYCNSDRDRMGKVDKVEF